MGAGVEGISKASGYNPEDDNSCHKLDRPGRLLETSQSAQALPKRNQ